MPPIASLARNPGETGDLQRRWDPHPLGHRHCEHGAPSSRSTRSRISAQVPSTISPSGSAPHPRDPTRCQVPELAFLTAFMDVAPWLYPKFHWMPGFDRPGGDREPTRRGRRGAGHRGRIRANRSPVLGTQGQNRATQKANGGWSTWPTSNRPSEISASVVSSTRRGEQDSVGRDSAGSRRSRQMASRGVRGSP